MGNRGETAERPTTPPDSPDQKLTYEQLAECHSLQKKTSEILKGQVFQLEQRLKRYQRTSSVFDEDGAAAVGEELAGDGVDDDMVNGTTDFVFGPDNQDDGKKNDGGKKNDDGGKKNDDGEKKDDGGKKKDDDGKKNNNDDRITWKENKKEKEKNPWAGNELDVLLTSAQSHDALEKAHNTAKQVVWETIQREKLPSMHVVEHAWGIAFDKGCVDKRWQDWVPDRLDRSEVKKLLYKMVKIRNLLAHPYGWQALRANDVWRDVRVVMELAEAYGAGKHVSEMTALMDEIHNIALQKIGDAKYNGAQQQQPRNSFGGGRHSTNNHNRSSLQVDDDISGTSERRPKSSAGYSMPAPDRALASGSWRGKNTSLDERSPNGCRPPATTRSVKEFLKDELVGVQVFNAKAGLEGVQGRRPGNTGQDDDGSSSSLSNKQAAARGGEKRSSLVNMVNKVRMIFRPNSKTTTDGGDGNDQMEEEEKDEEDDNGQETDGVESVITCPGPLDDNNMSRGQMDAFPVG